jgi:NADPH-dependent glutamate synthase beta subunit-like oxidoreductase/formate hydrogenlyase subunit 6/NADH:ubiquinone oxidoreductase subunit I
MVNEMVLDLANKISKKERGKKDEILATDPEYMILEPVVSTEMAEVAMALAFREPRSAEEVAPLCGKDVPTTYKLLMDLADAGVCFVNKKDGVDKFWYDTWIPGIMEMMVNKYSNVEKYPQIGRAMEAYGRVRGPKTAGIFPVGKGLMRVIPIEKAIQGETRRASYEEVSKYLNENDIFTVSNCSCRSTREIMGEGCGHLKEDMCIQMGHAAEYYIRTGRGRQITREEAFEIIKRAEENGLMHQIPNIDGGNKTHAICNCCGCGCLSLRTAEMFHNTDMVRSNYVATVDKEKCMACGECVENCPVGALKLGQKIATKKPLPKLRRPDLPTNTEWTPDKWNPDYRTNRKVSFATGTSPCKAECPAHIGVQGYIKLASEGKYSEALELIKRENPLPAICGRICSKRCEAGCTRNGLDESVAVDDIKKFIADQDLVAEHRFVPAKRHDYSDKAVAVVGSGPAGLSCAYFLAVEGYKVTVFEKERILGGMLTLGIPGFRLEKGVINAEIEILKELGVEFKTGVEVGKDLSLKQLREQGYKGFYLAIGAQAGRKLGIEGEDSEGVLSGIDFMRRVNLGDEIRLPGKVVVIGGGNVAIDVARTATRVGAASVSMYCLESRAEMPAAADEIAEAEEERISIDNGWGPKRIVVENGRVKGVEFKKCVSVFDENKRFSPRYDDSVTKLVEADFVLSSIGQAIEWGKLLEGSKVELKPNKGPVADGLTYQTAEGDVFVGGDVFTGPRFAIDAIAAGKEGAISLHRFVQKGQSLVMGRLKRDYVPLNKDNVDLDGFDSIPRQKAPRRSAAAAGDASFKDERGTFSPEQIKKEAERCLTCGLTYVDDTMCVGCGMCTTKCKFDAIKLVRKYDGEGVDYRDLKPIIIKSVLKRKVRIAAHNAARPISNLVHRGESAQE